MCGNTLIISCSNNLEKFYVKSISLEKLSLVLSLAKRKLVNQRKLSLYSWGQLYFPRS